MGVIPANKSGFLQRPRVPTYLKVDISWFSILFFILFAVNAFALYATDYLQADYTNPAEDKPSSFASFGMLVGALAINIVFLIPYLKHATD